MHLQSWTCHSLHIGSCHREDHAEKSPLSSRPGSIKMNGGLMMPANNMMMQHEHSRWAVAQWKDEIDERVRAMMARTGRTRSSERRWRVHCSALIYIQVAGCGWRVYNGSVMVIGNTEEGACWGVRREYVWRWAARLALTDATAMPAWAMNCRWGCRVSLPTAWPHLLPTP